MENMIAVLVIVILVGSAAAYLIKAKRSGVKCEHCVQSVTDSLNRIDGVSARVDLNKSCAEISLDREIGEDILICAVEKAGFLVESIQS